MSRGIRDDLRQAAVLLASLALLDRDVRTTMLPRPDETGAASK